MGGGAACTLSMETLPLLQRLAQRASEHGINFNNRVIRDESFHPLHGGHAIVYKGTINPGGILVSIKSLRLSPSADETAGDVHALQPYCGLGLPN